jgi:hypothetical protein
MKPNIFGTSPTGLVHRGSCQSVRMLGIGTATFGMISFISGTVEALPTEWCRPSVPA